MNKKVVVVSGTMRRNGNSRILAEEFARGAKDAGNEVTKVDIRDLDLQFCTGCLSCNRTAKCVLKDSMNELYDTFQSADVLAFATPIYYYAVSGQLKTFLDRLNPLYVRDNKFKKVYLLATAAENDKSAMDGAIKDIQGWVDCFDGVKFENVVYGIGVGGAGEVTRTAAVAEAYKTGASI